MILHSLASRRADYIMRRGLVAKMRRDEADHHRQQIGMLSQILPQAQEAGASRHVEEIQFALLAHREWLADHHAKE